MLTTLCLKAALLPKFPTNPNPVLLIHRVTRLMTHSESQCEIHQLTPMCQLRNVPKTNYNS